MILSGDVLRAVADGASTNREVAEQTGKTVREAQTALADLVNAGFRIPCPPRCGPTNRQRMGLVGGNVMGAVGGGEPIDTWTPFLAYSDLVLIDAITGPTFRTIPEIAVRAHATAPAVAKWLESWQGVSHFTIPEYREDGTVAYRAGGVAKAWAKWHREGRRGPDYLQEDE